MTIRREQHVLAQWLRQYFCQDHGVRSVDLHVHYGMLILHECYQLSKGYAMQTSLIFMLFLRRRVSSSVVECAKAATVMLSLQSNLVPGGEVGQQFVVSTVVPWHPSEHSRVSVWLTFRV